MHIIPENDSTITYLLKLISEEHILSLLSTMDLSTGVDFKPFKMDLATLQEFKNYTKNLTENDKVRLQRLKSGEFSELVDYMLKNNCKLEQEAIHF